LYPLLKELTESTIKLVVYRHPIESAESLWRRNRFPIHYGLALWEKYYYELFGSISSDNLLVINYNKLLNNPEDGIKYLINGINRISGYVWNDYDASFAASFVSKKLYRSTQSIGLTDDYLTDSQKDIFNQLSNFEIGRDLKQVSGPSNYTVLKQNQYFTESVTTLLAKEKLLFNYEIELEEIRHLAIKRKSEIVRIKSSLTWKLTKPLRYLEIETKKLRWAKFVVRMLRVIYRKNRQIMALLRTKIKKYDWDPPVDMEENILNYKENSLARNKKVVVYTAVFGGYNTLTLPDHLESDIDYVCFTDHSINSFGVWKIRAAPYYHPDATRIARYVKTHPHNLLAEYDIAVWVDANIVIRGDVWKYINRVKDQKADIGFVSHPLRDCVYDEAEACKKLNKDQHAIIDMQIERYKRASVPSNVGLYETNIFVTKLNNSDTRSFFKYWWNEIEMFSRRDQLSVGWALFNSNVKETQLMEKDVSVRNNIDFTLFPHEKTRNFSTPKSLKKFRLLEDPYSGSMFSDVKEKRLKVTSNKSIDIVVCVYNALEDVKLCLSSVIKDLASNVNIIIVNDVSNNETTDYLRQFSEDNDKVTLLENERNLGYTRSANRGLQTSNAGFRIMLNSDTIVSKDWALKMAAVAYSSESIGVVGPLSNAASSQSIPEIKGTKGQTVINQLSKDMKPSDLDLACEKWALADLFPRVPLIHGFCFGIKKSVIDSIGFFDEINFERYYGEENDYCFRARAAGFESAIATNTFVYHRKSRSIKEEERLVHMDKAGKRLRELYGAENVSLACRQMADHPLLIRMRKLAAKHFF